jgi:DNA-binding NtrC family response regulator
VGEKGTILIADRNRHVREFLKREMAGDGYEVRLANTAAQVLNYAFGPDRIDLVIIDPDFPDMNEGQLLKEIEDRIPTLPVVVHAFSSEPPSWIGNPKTAVFVEKEGASIEDLKRVVRDLLQFAQPRIGGGSAHDEAAYQGRQLPKKT